MSSLLPVALYGLEVPPGEMMIPAAADFPATIRITMAAIDPTEETEDNEDGTAPQRPRSTLKLIKTRMGDGGIDEDDEEDDEELRRALGLDGEDEDDDEDDEDDEVNGGPSDPAKSKKARRANGIKELLEATKDADSEDDMEDDDEDTKPNGLENGKGKEKASDEDDEDEDEEEDSDDDEDMDGLDLEQFVVCTLDPESHYQQPLDLTVGEGEKVFFVVSGTHTIHLTGNYVIDDSEETDSEDEDEYDLPPDELEDLVGDSDEEYDSDELDGIDIIDRIKEVVDEDEEDEEAPALVPAKKGKNKRAAEDEADGLDDLIAKETAGATDEPKLSKKQQKKLKNNKGQAVEVEENKSKPAAKDKETNGQAKSDKKVQFAKELEQGPTGSAEKAKAAEAKASIGVKVVQGVTIDDRKIGTGRTVKAGDKVGMRYIGKLQNGKVFDSNKKGAPFTTKIGKGEVIKGWDIGIIGMSVGGERRLTVPAHLAYGAKGVPGIPPNSTLIFDVKLLEIK